MTDGQAVGDGSLNFVALAIFSPIGSHALVAVVLDFWLPFANDPFVPYSHCLCKPVLLLACMW